MPTFEIHPFAKDLPLGTPCEVFVKLTGATPFTMVTAVVTTPQGSWNTQVPVNSEGSGGGIVSGVDVGGSLGTTTLVILRGTASSAVDVFPPSTADVTVHG
jgi:hypothetical protein